MITRSEFAYVALGIDDEELGLDVEGGVKIELDHYGADADGNRGEWRPMNDGGEK